MKTYRQKPVARPACLPAAATGRPDREIESPNAPSFRILFGQSLPAGTAVYHHQNVLLCCWYVTTAVIVRYQRLVQRPCRVGRGRGNTTDNNVEWNAAAAAAAVC